MSLLRLQLDPGLDEVEGLVEGLPQGYLHQVLVIGSHHIPTQEDHCIGQELGGRVNRDSETGWEVGKGNWRG